MKLTQKIKIAEELHEKFRKSVVVIVTDYKGLDVKATTEMRRRLRDADIEYKVVKNSLLVRASKETDAALLQDYFLGPSAVALSYDDPVAPAKVLIDFAKENDKLEIKAGVLNGKTLSLDDLKALASLPSREELLGTLVYTINAVPTKLVRTLNAIPGQFVNVLNALKEKKEDAPEA
ncbi:MAG: 50S ribosomal protein L10 [Desulfobacterales bacterium]|nr:50S ribosomal protein L10 [Desulfobacterales bacterium]